MTIFQSDVAKGKRTAPTPYVAGVDVTARFEYTFNAAAATTDIIEIGVLPARSQIVDAAVITEGTFTGITADIGIMTGAFGSTDVSRTANNALFAAVDLAAANAAIQRVSKPNALLLTATEADRSLGLVVSGAVAAASTKKITLLVTYRQ